MIYDLQYTYAMSALGKEQEMPILTPEELAAQQLEGYIEKVEKQAEIPKDISQVVQPVVTPQLTQPMTNNQGQVVMQQARQEDPEIDLPLTESEVRDGLHHKVVDGFRWLAEWCVMVIKKYPGRVFYRNDAQ